MTQINSAATPTPLVDPAVPQPPSNSAETALYVGDLRPHVSETALHSIFGMEPGLMSVRVCRDSNTGRSLGYAYVNFRSAEEAHSAMEKFIFTPISGNPCRIMLCHRDPSLRRSGKGNVFVKNLDKGLDVKSLYKSFGFMGKILSFKLATDDKGRSKGFGFIHYADESVVNKVIEKLNGKVFQEKTLYVARFIPRKDRIKEGTPLKFNNLFVKNIDDSVTDEKLHEWFSPYGSIISAKVMKNDDGSSRRFGFVCFQNFGDAEKAVSHMNDKQISPDVKLFVGRAMKKTERTNMLKAYYDKMKQDRADKYQGCNLYIKNLMETIDDDRLRQEFSKFGVITSAKVMKDDKGISKGFGFVCFEVIDSANMALKAMENAELDGKRIYVAVAQLKEMRQASLIAKFARSGSLNVGSFYPQPEYNYHLRPQRYQVDHFSAVPPDLMMPPYSMTNMMPGHRRPPHMAAFDRYPGPHAPMYRTQRGSYTPRAPGGFNLNFQGGMQRRIPGMPNGQHGSYPRGSLSNRLTQQQQIYRENHYQPNFQHDLAVSQKHLASPNRMSMPHSIPVTSAVSQSAHANRIAESHSLSSIVSSSQSSLEEKSKHSIGVKELLNMGIHERKKILGSAINNLAFKMYGSEAPKITGVLLESDMDLISKMQDEPALRAEITAVHVALCKAASEATAAATVSSK